MISLLTLQKLASKAFPGKMITASHLLFVWASEAKAELGGMLAPSGLDVERLKQTLCPLTEEPREEDKQLTTDCILSVSGRSVSGWYLLNVLCNRPEHRITKALVEAGMDLDGLRKGLDDNAPQDLLALLRAQATKTSELLQYGRDLTAEAAGDAFDDLCPRPQQTKGLVRILLRMTRSNPVLTGPAGVGKTALVELLARQLAKGEVPEKLIGTRLFEVSMGKLVAGTKYRGQFEERFETVMKALKKAGPAILFIDEFHLVWGAGRAEGAPMDVANMLKPLLNRGRLRIIGATTSDEYHRYIEQDPALARRFEELRLEPPDGALLLEMLKAQREKLEQYHDVTIPDDLLPRAVALTDEHLPNRHQPDKAISLLDSSAAAARPGATLSENDLLQTLEEQTGRPLTEVEASQRQSLLKLCEKLKRRIIGQDEAIDKVVSTLIYRRQHLGEAERNLGSFLFVGNTGVGKTELARSLAVEMFESEKALLRLDMAEYSSYEATQKLLGTALTFPGSQEGVLASWLYSRGTGVILFDEIEKASREVRQLLLGLLDRGRLRNARGEELDTRQCVIVLTSNAISPDALKKKPIGFGDSQDRSDITDLLADSFPREFLGRLDEIIVFHDLDDEALKQILKLHLDQSLSRFAKEGVTVKYDEERLLHYLLHGLKEAKDSGARGIKRLLERLLLQSLAVALAGYQRERPVTVNIADAFYSSGKMQLSPG